MTGRPGEPTPCPGLCNRAWRAAVARADDRAWAVVERLRPMTDDDWRVIDHGQWPVLVEHVPGVDRPWCEPCAARVEQSLIRLTDLAAQLWTVGHDDESVQRVVVDRAVRVLAPQVLPDRVVPGRLVIRERLSCRHVHRLPDVTSTVEAALVAAAGVAAADQAFTSRECVACWLGQRSDGRVAPPQGKAPRRRTSPASPAGSQSWLEIDAIVAWVATAHRYLADLLGHRPPADHRVASTQARAAVLATGVRYLVEWLPRMLVSPWGVGARRRADRARAARRVRGRRRRPGAARDDVPWVRPASPRTAVVRGDRGLPRLRKGRPTAERRRPRIIEAGAGMRLRQSDLGLLTYGEAAAIARVEPGTIRSWISRHSLTVVELDGGRFLLEREVLECERARRTSGRRRSDTPSG